MMKIPYIISLTLLLLFCSLSTFALTTQERKVNNLNRLLDFAEEEYPELFPEHQTTQVYNSPEHLASPVAILIPTEWLYRSYSNDNAIGILLLSEFFVALPFISSRDDKNIMSLGQSFDLEKKFDLEDDPDDSCFLMGF